MGHVFVMHNCWHLRGRLTDGYRLLWNTKPRASSRDGREA
jgi:hypothetical protein